MHDETQGVEIAPAQLEPSELPEDEIDIEDGIPDWVILSETLQEAPRPFLTTSFEDYTVTEGFLLTFLLCAFLAAIYHTIRRFV